MPRLLKPFDTNTKFVVGRPFSIKTPDGKTLRSGEPFDTGGVRPEIVAQLYHERMIVPVRGTLPPEKRNGRVISERIYSVHAHLDKVHQPHQAAQPAALQKPAALKRNSFTRK